MNNQKQQLIELRKRLGNNIYQQRLRKKLTLHKLSRLTGITIVKLDQYEIGKNQISLEDTYALAKLFGIEITALLG